VIQLIDRYVGDLGPRVPIEGRGVQDYLDSLLNVIAHHMDITDDSLFMAGATVKKICRAAMRTVECRFTSVDDHGERKMCSIFDHLSVFFSMRFTDQPLWELTYHHTPNIKDIVLCGDLDRFEKDFLLLKITLDTLLYDLAVVPSSE
jgi:hypothetical protein